jgi:hypothetical protein
LDSTTPSSSLFVPILCELLEPPFQATFCSSEKLRCTSSPYVDSRTKESNQNVLTLPKSGHRPSSPTSRNVFKATEVLLVRMCV